MSAFYERTDSRTKGELIALAGLIATGVTAVIAFLLIQKTGAPGFAALLLPMGSLIVAGIALRRSKEGIRKGYALSPEGIEEITGENHVILRFRDIRKTRRVLDHGGYSLCLTLYPETGSPMRVTRLSGPDATGIDTFVESSLPPNTERVLIREARTANAFRKHGDLLLYLLLFVGPDIVNAIRGVKSGTIGFIGFFLIIFTAMAWSRLTSVDFRRDDYSGKFPASRVLALCAVMIAYLALSAWHRQFTPVR